MFRAACGVKASRRDFRNHLRDCTEHLGFEACLVFPYVCMRPTIKANGQEHFEHVLPFTCDELVVS